MSPSTYALYDISSLVYELCQFSCDTFAEACDIVKVRQNFITRLDL